MYYTNDYLTHGYLKEMRLDYKYWLNNGYKRLPGANVRALYKIENNKVFLQSYYTEVLMLDLEEKSLYKLWSGYSATTLKHINLLCKMFDFPTFNKKEWEKMKVDKTCLDYLD